MSPTFSSPQAIDINHFPWSRPLVAACLRDFASVGSLFAGNPSDPLAWTDAVRRVQGVARDHAAISRVLSDQLIRRNAPAPARDAALSLADPRTVVVVTGQQAGLFGGPLYTILKAITAMQLARRLERDHGVRTVPIFWAEVEDHDWIEVRTAHILDGDHNLRDITAPDVAGAGQQPVGRLALDGRIEETLAELFAALPPSTFTGELRAQLARHYVAGATVSTAFAGWMDDLFGEHGMVVFESGDPAAKPLVADLFANELRHPGRTSQLVAETAHAMRQLGHEPQIDPSDDSIALFYLGAAARTPIKRRGDQLDVGGALVDATALVDEATSHPERFSPNVLLRPLVQDRLFPTVCYVAGPSEIAYQAQLGGAYRALQVEPPLLMPRVSATLLDSAAVRFLERHDLSLEELHQREDVALTRLVERALPTSVEQAIDAMQQSMGEHGRGLKEAILALDTTLAGAVDTTLDRMRDSLQTLHAKIVQAAKRNDDTLRRQFKRTYALVYPGGSPQERTLGAVFFLNRYGPNLIQQLLDTLPLQTDQHYALSL